MNLNFIQDNDQIHVETQNQSSYKQEIILKAKLLKQDFKDYSQVHPSLTQVNTLFTQIVKDLYEHVTNMKERETQASEREIQVSSLADSNIEVSKKKKKVSIPYGTMKKLQSLKQKLIICRKIINNQNLTYRNFNMNSQNYKISDVKFYKQILTSYEGQRQYFKKQTLQLEDRVQQVETQVKKLSYNDNHSFTDFESKIIPTEAILKYEKKMIAFAKVMNEMNLLRKTKQKIKNALNIAQRDDRNIQVSSKGQKIVYGKTFFKSISSNQKKINLLQRCKTQMLQSKLIRQQNEVDKLKVINQRLKKSILQSEGIKYFYELERKILNLEGKPQIDNKTAKVTKTDYMLYLKQINSQIKQYFKSKQIVYRCKMPQHSKNLHQRSNSTIFSKH